MPSPAMPSTATAPTLSQRRTSKESCAEDYPCRGGGENWIILQYCKMSHQAPRRRTILPGELTAATATS